MKHLTSRKPSIPGKPLGSQRQFKISKQANKFILSLPGDLREKIKIVVTRLMSGEMETLEIARLEPYPNEYRLRVGKVRILFRSTDQLLFIFKAGFRGDVYKS